jgi:Fe2+ transport system protein FeoA
MTTLLDSNSRTVHLPTRPVPEGEVARSPRKGLRLTDLRDGETARVVRLSLPDSGCRKRFAELGLAEGMKVTVASGAGADTMMLIVGGSRMGISGHCAAEIHVIRVSV